MSCEAVGMAGRRGRGFTLLEVLVALVVLALSLAPSLSVTVRVTV